MSRIDIRKVKKHLMDCDSSYRVVILLCSNLELLHSWGENRRADR